MYMHDQIGPITICVLKTAQAFIADKDENSYVMFLLLGERSFSNQLFLTGHRTDGTASSLGEKHWILALGHRVQVTLDVLALCSV